jgi:hypothetical protein
MMMRTESETSKIPPDEDALKESGAAAVASLTISYSPNVFLEVPRKPTVVPSVPTAFKIPEYLFVISKAAIQAHSKV